MDRGGYQGLANDIDYLLDSTILLDMQPPASRQQSLFWEDPWVLQFLQLV